MAHSDTGLIKPNDIKSLQAMNQGEILPAIRDEQGKFIPGVSGNPSGRPATTHITDAYKSILETEGAEQFARVITGIALDETNKPTDRIAAIQEITDRVEGRAVQNMSIRGNIVMMAPDAVKDAAFGEDEPQ